LPNSADDPNGRKFGELASRDFKLERSLARHASPSGRMTQEGLEKP